jgi:hypothetical protein
MHLLLLSILLIVLSCNSPNQDSSGVQTNDSRTITQADTVTSAREVCYWKIMQRDTFAVHLLVNGNSISGKMNFDNFEKDASSGPVHGSNVNGIYYLWYDFQSEGMKSVMEIHFKEEGNSLIRGVGPMEVKGDSSYFPDAKAVKFNDADAFKIVDCRVIPGKYKK